MSMAQQIKQIVASKFGRNKPKVFATPGDALASMLGKASYAPAKPAAKPTRKKHGK